MCARVCGTAHSKTWFRTAQRFLVYVEGQFYKSTRTVFDLSCSIHQPHFPLVGRYRHPPTTLSAHNTIPVQSQLSCFSYFRNEFFASHVALLSIISYLLYKINCIRPAIFTTFNKILPVTFLSRKVNIFY